MSYSYSNLQTAETCANVLPELHRKYAKSATESTNHGLLRSQIAAALSAGPRRVCGQELSVFFASFESGAVKNLFGNKLASLSVFTSMKTLLTLAVLVCLAMPGFSADKKPDFSGTWKLNPAKSEMGGSPVESLIVDVDHKDPVFKYTARGTASGQEFEETETIYTDGKPSQDSQGAAVTAHWDGAALVSEAKDNNGQVLYTSELTLSNDGKTITRILIQKGPGDAQSRRELYEKQ